MKVPKKTKPNTVLTPSSNHTDDEKDDDRENRFKNGGCWSTVVWSLTVLAVSAVFVYVGVLLVLKFKAESTRVVCQIKPLKSSFPMVTLCNMNPYKASASPRFPDLARLIERYDRTTASRGRQLNEATAIGGVEQRRKRDYSPCKCNFDNPQTVKSNDGQRTYILYPKMVTNWDCGFACCSQSDLDGRLARPTKEDVSVLKANGMLDGWTFIAVYCKAPGSCLWYDGPNSPVGSKTVSMDSVCDGCSLVSGGSPVGKVVLNYYGKARAPLFRITRFPENDSNTPLCQVQDVSHRSIAINDNQTTTRGGLKTNTGHASSATSNKQAASTTRRAREQSLVDSKISTAPTISTARIFETTQRMTVSPETKSTIADVLSSRGGTNAPEQNHSTTNHAINQYLDDSKIDHLSLSAVARDMVPYIMSPVDLEKKIRAGYDAEEVVIRCAYNGFACSYRNFTTIVDPNHGNCYAFNSDGRYGSSRKPATGETGLSVSYAVGTSEYLSFIESTGIRVIVSEQDKPVFPDAEGFDVMSGYRTSVSLRATALRALSTRRKPCFSEGDNLDPYYYEEKKYSTEACLRSCYQRRVIEKCQCGDPRIPIPDNVTYCPLTNRHCVNENYEVTDGEQCNCPRECSIDEYDMAITKAKFSTKRITGQSTGHTADALDIDVYLASPIALECREELAYTVGMFCWDLANDIVTFTGVSAIYVIVVIKAIYQRTANVIRKMKGDPEEEADVAPQVDASQTGRDDSMSVQSL